jgi:hypothetical protein
MADTLGLASVPLPLSVLVSVLVLVFVIAALRGLRVAFDERRSAQRRDGQATQRAQARETTRTKSFDQIIEPVTVHCFFGSPR